MNWNIKKYLKWVAYALLSLALAIIANDQLRKFGNSISTAFLVDLVKEESAGKYQLQFSDLQLNILSQKITITEALLEPANFAENDTLLSKNLYRINVDKIYISVASVWKIYIDKELIVEGVEITNPEIRIKKINPEKASIKLGRETGELYDLISSYLKLLQIDYFIVNSAAVSHSPSNFAIDSVDLSISNFTVSQKKRKRKIFYSEAINLGIRNQSINLPDSIHQLNFQSFKLSTKDSLLQFKNLSIVQRDEKRNIADDQNIYAIQVPELQIKGIDYLKAYEENQLDVNHVFIPKPNIKIRTSRKKNDGEYSAKNTITKSLLALFDAVKIKDLSIEEGLLNWTFSNTKQQQFLSDNISIKLEEILIDSLNSNTIDVFDYFSHASVEVNNYQYNLPDSLHKLNFEKLSFSSKEEKLSIENLDIKPSRNESDSSQTSINLEIKRVALDGVQYKDILTKKQIATRTLKITSPKLIITPNQLQKSSTIAFSPSKLYQIISPYLEDLDSEHIELTGGTVSLREKMDISDIKINIEQFQFDSTTTSWHQFAQKIQIAGERSLFKIKENTFAVDSFKIQDTLRSLQVNGLSYEEQSTVALINSLKVTGIQLDSILEKQVVAINAVATSGGDFSLDLLQKTKSPQTSWKLPEKPIVVIVEKTNLNLRLDKNRLLRSSEVAALLSISKTGQVNIKTLGASGISYQDSLFAHFISAKSINYGLLDDHLSIRDVQISPKKKNQTQKIRMDIATIDLYGIDQNELKLGESVNADSLVISVENLSSVWQQKDSVQFDIKEETNFKAKLNIGKTKIHLKKSTFSLIGNDTGDFQMKNQSTNLTLDALVIDNLKTFDFNELLKNLSINGLYTEIILKNKEDFVLNNYNYNSRKNFLEVQKIDIVSADSTRQLHAKGFEVNGLSFHEYATNNKLNLRTINLASADLFFTINGNEKLDFKEGINLPVLGFSTDDFQIKQLNVTISHQERGRDYLLRKAELNIGQLKIDSIFYPKRILKSFESLVFKGKNYTETYGDHYTVTAKDYSFSYPDASFSANEIKMRSRYDSLEYSEKINFQSDWFKLDLETIALLEIDLDNLVQKQELKAKKLIFDHADLTVFRDLNVPLNETKYVAMPQAVLKKLDLPFKIDSILLHANIYIHILPKGVEDVGTVTINNIEGLLTNLASSYLMNNSPIRLTATGKLFNKGNFNASINFPVPSNKGKFQFRGNIGPMNLQELNPMLIPLTAIEVRSGTNDGVSFNFNGNDDYAEGLMEFKYHDLRVNFLDRKTYQAKGFGNNLKTMFANSFVINSKNPRWFKVQNGRIFFERIKARSIFNLWAKSLLSGAVSSIGINKNKSDAKEYHRNNEATFED